MKSPLPDCVTDFPYRLEELRLASGRSRKDLADSLGTTEWRIVYWENGWHLPHVYAIAAIALEFGCTTDYLLGISDSTYYNSYETNGE